MNRTNEYKKLINTRRWQYLRLQALSKSNYLCAVCLENDITTPAEEVHHVTPVQTGSTFEQMKRLCYDPNNLLAVCKECHKNEHIKLNSYTAEETQKRNKNKTDHFIEKFLTKKDR